MTEPASSRMPESDRAFLERWARRVLTFAAVTAALLGLLWLLKGALTPVAVAFFLAYLFDPVIDRFEERKIGRRVEIVRFLGLAGAVVLGFAFFIVPRMQREIAELTERMPAYYDAVVGRVGPTLEGWLGRPLPGTLGGWVEGIGPDQFAPVLDAGRKALAGVGGFFAGTLGALVGLLVIPVITYYVLVDFDHLKHRILALVPRDHQDTVASKAAMVDRLLAGFFRGQFLVCLVLGTLYALGFAAIGVNLAVVIGSVAGLLSIIPYVGSGVALVSATLMCLVQFGVDVHVALVIGWYALVQTLEGFVLTPRIVGSSVGLHPATVIIALLIGGDLLGFLGLIVAVPAAAVIQVFVLELHDAYLSSSLYQPSAADP